MTQANSLLLQTSLMTKTGHLGFPQALLHISPATVLFAPFTAFLPKMPYRVPDVEMHLQK